MYPESQRSQIPSKFQPFLLRRLFLQTPSFPGSRQPPAPRSTIPPGQRALQPTPFPTLPEPSPEVSRGNRMAPGPRPPQPPREPATARRYRKPRGSPSCPASCPGWPARRRERPPVRGAPGRRARGAAIACARLPRRPAARLLGMPSQPALAAGRGAPAGSGCKGAGSWAQTGGGALEPAGSGPAVRDAGR